jgi:sodium--glutamate symport carrier gltS
MVMMALQVILIALIAYFLVFKLFGNSYDSAVMANGLCGFGLGGNAFGGWSDESAQGISTFFFMYL